MPFMTQTSMMRALRAAPVAAAVVMGAGCATLLPVERPALGVPIPAEWTGAAVAAGELGPEWWTDFGDDALSAAIETVLSRNLDLAAAAARLEQAAADARVASGALRPTIQASYNGSRRKQNFVGFPIPGAEDEVLSTVFTNQGVSLDTTWEVDLWGKLRTSEQAALADLQRSAADLRGAQTVDGRADGQGVVRHCRGAAAGVADRGDRRELRRVGRASAGPVRIGRSSGARPAAGAAEPVERARPAHPTASAARRVDAPARGAAGAVCGRRPRPAAGPARDAVGGAGGGAGQPRGPASGSGRGRAAGGGVRGAAARGAARAAADLQPDGEHGHGHGCAA